MSEYAHIMDKLKRRFQVSQWIAEEFAGINEEEHRAELEAWRKETSGNEQEYQELVNELRQGQKEIFYSKEVIGQQWKKFRKKHIAARISLRTWYRYAAIVTLIIGCVGILKWQLVKEKTPVEVVCRTIPIVQESPLLILADGRTMSLSDSADLTQERILPRIHFKNRWISYQQMNKEITGEVYNTLIVPKGGEYQIQLEDGSLVWLNAETELRYPVKFNSIQRHVYLKGEAYFEVAENVEKPFIVTTSGGVDVKVLGTKFNIASYDDDEQVITTLAEGSVEVGNQDQTMRLKPEEQVIFSKEDQSFRTQKVDVGLYISWKDGKFIFEEQTLEQIMKQLQRWYKMTVFYTNEEIKQYRFSGDLKKYDDFDKIVWMLEEVAGIKVSIKENCVVIGAK